MDALIVVLFIILAIFIIAALFSIITYNRLVRLYNRIQLSFHQIRVQLARRNDIIPDLIRAAEGYMQHERGTFESIANSRNQIVNTIGRADPHDHSAIHELGNAEMMLSGLMRGFLIEVERYPELKADKLVSQNMTELTKIGETISFARSAYNDAVVTYNIYRETFPAVLTSERLGFRKAELLETTQEENKIIQGRIA